MVELRIWSDYEFVNQTFPTNPLVSGDIVDAGEKILIAGPSESGKSFLALQWAMELASQGDWFGFSVMRKCRVLVLQSEVSTPRYQERYNKLRGNYDGELDLFIATTEELKLDTVVGCNAFADVVRDYVPDVVIFDPLRAFMEGDENNSKDVERFFQYVSKTQADDPFTLMVIHHVVKPMPGSHYDELTKWAIRGSGLITDRPSTIVGLTCNEAQTKWKLFWLKTRNRNRHPESLDLVANFTTGLFDIDASSPTVSGIGFVVEALDGGERKQSEVVKDLVEDCKVNRATVYGWITDAVRNGCVHQIASGGRGGGYTLVPTPI